MRADLGIPEVQKTTPERSSEHVAALASEHTGLPSAVLSRFGAVPRPFLRWAGSKQALLPHLIRALPRSFGRYYEPFLGAGALFFHLKPRVAVLSDIGTELISTWMAVRDHRGVIADYLRPLKPDRDLYYQIRERRSEDPAIRAAELLYLNKACWNGLYRVNSKGKFNVPYGRPRSDFIFDEQNLYACSKLLNEPGVQVRQSDFAEAVLDAKEGDLVYFDPPYVTGHNNNGFRDYNEKLFSWSDQVRLAAQAQQLANRGVHVVISNADHKDVRELYAGFNIASFERSSTLASTAKFRGKVGEIIATAGGTYGC